MTFKPPRFFGLIGSMLIAAVSLSAAFNASAQATAREAEGFHARVVQHECDHLAGKLYPMRIRDFSRFGFTSVLFPGLDAGDDE